MDFAGVPLATIVVAIAGPLGVTMGWWLGRRSQRERESRDERKSAYTEFIRAVVAFRSADQSLRREIRGDRWSAISVLILVAPRDVYVAAWAVLSVQERLLEELDGAGLAEVQDEIWRRFSRFANLARADLGVSGNPFGEYRPTVSQSGPPIMDETSTEPALPTPAQRA